MSWRGVLGLVVSVLIIGAVLFARHAWNNGTRPEAGELDLAAEMWAHERLVAVKTAPDADLSAFDTDGCSGGMSVIWREMSSSLPVLQSQIGQRPPWEQCCISHDRAYHSAGSAITPKDSFQARLDTDWALRECIVATGIDVASRNQAIPEIPALSIEQAYTVIGDMIYSAVRIGGGPCSGLPWRWGFGYPDCGLVQETP